MMYSIHFIIAFIYAVDGIPQYFFDAFKKAEQDVATIYNYTEPRLFNHYESASSLPLSHARNDWLHFTYSTPEAKRKAFLGYTMLRTAELMKTPVSALRHIRGDEMVADEQCDQNKFTCSNYNYRAYDGSCNNIKRPDWGATYTPFQREIDADYSDGLTSFRKSENGDDLPNPRALSRIFFNERQSDERIKEVSAMFPSWGLFVLTDMVQIGSYQLIQDDIHIPLPCCENNSHPECKPIPVPENDRFYNRTIDCIDYSRTMIAPRNCAFGPREQQNQATGYLDGSAIYGSTEEKARELRELKNGRLRVSESAEFANQMPILTGISENKKCPGAQSECFVSGSNHINLLPTLLGIHTLWIRQHNTVAGVLQSFNPKWSDEQLYQESRRFVAAQIQHITYNEYLPLLIGRETWHGYRLNPHRSDLQVDPYDMSVDGSVINSYATVAGQVVFTMLADSMAQLERSGYRRMEKPLGEYINRIKTLLVDQDIESILRYLLRDHSDAYGLHLPHDLRNNLFKSTAGLGLDLATMWIQMGRDHGIPPYTKWREHCGGSRIDSFDDPDFRRDITNAEDVIPALKRMFNSVHDVDLIILGLAEKPVRGAIVGPTLGCIVGKQFKKTKFGDRFWYENTIAPWGFTKAQLNEIRKTTLAQVLCENSQLPLIQPQVFKYVDKKDNFPLLCNTSDIVQQSFEPWRDSENVVQMPVTMATVEKAIEIGLKVVKERRKRETENIKKYQGVYKRGDPLLAYGQMMRAKKEALHTSTVSSVLLEATRFLVNNGSLSRDGGISEVKLDSETLQRLLPDLDVSEFVGNIVPFLGTDGSIEKCLPKDLPCDHTSPYRTFSGWCNNLRFPHYGNSFGPLRHIFPPDYEDAIDAPRAFSVTGHRLPLARAISNAIHVDSNASDEKFTHMVMQFGQLLDHEITHSPVERGPNNEILNCTRCDSPQTLSVHCMPIPVPDDDDTLHQDLDGNKQECFPMARSLLGQLSLGYRNQLNQLTAFIDGSAIYGSTKCEAAVLRKFHAGLMNFTYLGAHNTEALPQGDQEQDCRSKPRFPCFEAGDERNSHQPGLTAMHNIFLRQHNAIARDLARINPHWDDEALYQESRKIVGAIFQHIVYDEYLPKLLGRRYMEKYELSTKKSGYFRKYDDSCDASISHPFATAAFRFGHTLIRRFFPRLNQYYKNFTAPVDLQEHFNNVEPVYDHEKGGIDSIIVGLLGTRCMAFDRHITDAVRNHLFQQKGFPHSGFDLIALNIMRARDHGVQPYNRFREFCGLKRANNFYDLHDVMAAESVKALESIYEDVDDIDLFPGLFSERPLGGALMPPTMACLLGEQFQRLKNCDRFYYENDIPETRFTPEQLQEIRSVKLATVLCNNSLNLTRIQPDVFSIPNSLSNAQIPCTNFPRINLKAWEDTSVCRIGNSAVPRGSSKQRSPCVNCMCTATGLECRSIRVPDCRALIRNNILTEIKADVTCMVQCAGVLRKL
ncbi:unnamed protein product [Bursaphelenchus xylophilus]|uniref:(pine wood nematode) hypothetical protein n=1 Tax=Bursaphelenchus xylophilus TaxID=6326 RepID=A0A1I7RWB4_BURXY|nr:unnamed protein product [Bursaphelenchus xylophilus]CAG9095408.1 unnamed protein product [Bursaphelenchus xylophilus]